MSTRPSVALRLTRLGACGKALAWAEDYRSPQAAWDACRRPDWMLWLLHLMGADRGKALNLLADMVALTLPGQPPSDRRVTRAIELARSAAEVDPPPEEPDTRVPLLADQLLKHLPNRRTDRSRPKLYAYHAAHRLLMSIFRYENWSYVAERVGLFLQYDLANSRSATERARMVRARLARMVRRAFPKPPTRVRAS